MSTELARHRPDRNAASPATRWRSSVGGVAIALLGVLSLAGGAHGPDERIPDSAEAFEFRPRPAPELPAPELADAWEGRSNARARLPVDSEYPA
jgi:fermentation-respiration switch protein FrsA (DUF1100 family)